MEKKLFIYLGLAVCIFTSCKNVGFDENEILTGDEVEVCVEIPQWPPEELKNQNVPEINYWVIAADSAVDTQDLIYEPSTVTSTGQCVCFNVKKNAPFCVTATPVLKDKNQLVKEFFKCAGLVYPFGKEKSNMMLSWEEGFSATLMRLLFNNAKEMNYSPEEIEDYILKFNWDKLNLIIEEKSKNEEKNYNPWLLKSAEVANAISNKSFSVSNLNLKNVAEVSVEGLGSILSSYVPENKNIEKNSKILIKKSEVNVFSDYNLNGILLKGDTVQDLSIENISLPIYIDEYEKKSKNVNSVSYIASSFVQRE